MMINCVLFQDLSSNLVVTATKGAESVMHQRRLTYAEVWFDGDEFSRKAGLFTDPVSGQRAMLFSDDGDWWAAESRLVGDASATPNLVEGQYWIARYPLSNDSHVVVVYDNSLKEWEAMVSPW